MTYGRKVCNTLKEIRRQIADKNEIEYTTSECHFEGECEGTCPKCESEVKYLENELHRRTQLGKAVAVAGISLGMAGTFSACNTPKQENVQEASVELTEIPDTTIDILYPPPPNWMGFITPEIVELVSQGEITAEDTIKEFPLPLAGVVSDTFDEKNCIGIDNTDLLEYQKKMEAEAIKIYELADVDVHPSFPGGDKELNKFLADNLKIPPTTRNLNSGIVLVRFIVEKNGDLTNFEIVKSPQNILSDAVIRVIKLMPKWLPAQKDEKPVRVQYQIPVEFKMD